MRRPGETGGHRTEPGDVEPERLSGRQWAGAFVVIAAVATAAVVGAQGPSAQNSTQRVEA